MSGGVMKGRASLDTERQSRNSSWPRARSTITTFKHFYPNTVISPASLSFAAFTSLATLSLFHCSGLYLGLLYSSHH